MGILVLAIFGMSTFVSQLIGMGFNKILDMFIQMKMEIILAF